MDVEKLTVANQHRIEKYLEEIHRKKKLELTNLAEIKKEKAIKQFEKTELAALRREANEINKKIKELKRKCKKMGCVSFEVSYYSEKCKVSVDKATFKYKNKKIENRLKKLDEYRNEIRKALIFKDLPKLKRAFEKLEKL